MRLFWRIFLSFWLAILLTLALAITGNSIVFRAELDNVRMETLRAALNALSEQAEGVLRREGEDGLRAWLREQARVQPSPQLLVIGPDEAELLGRRLPPGPARAAERWQRLQAEERGGRPRGRVPARRISDAEGRMYLMFAAPLPPRGGGLFLRPEARAGVLLMAVLISGLVCFLLARHLTGPVRALRATGERIAAGDLAARVEEPIARRRDELGELARDFNQMAGRIESLLASQARLLRDVSHELRSPLTRLQLAVALLRRREHGAPASDLERIEREARRMDGLIGQLLALTRLDSAAKPAATQLDLAAMLHALVEDASFEGESRGRTVVLEAPDHCLCQGDPQLLGSALENIVRNALDHARSRIAVSLTCSAAGTISVSVTDDGPGVPQEMLGRIFEPFVRADADAANRPGAGLGLAIARRAVELHEGRIEARNLPEGGFSVTVTLPARGPQG